MTENAATNRRIRNPSRRRTAVRRRQRPGKASLFIQEFDIQKGDKVVVAVRVSTRQQQHRQNLIDQEMFLRQQVARAGGVVVGVVAKAISGFDPWWLARAAVLAKKHNAVIVAESTDRFIRHPGYHSCRWPDAQARPGDLQDLQQVTDGVRLMTFLHPDATPEEIKSHATKRGMHTKQKMGGNPGYKKQRRMELLPEVIKLHRRGKSTRQIAVRIGVPQPTVFRWIQTQN